MTKLVYHLLTRITYLGFISLFWVELAVAAEKPSMPAFVSVNLPEIESLDGIFAIAQDHQGFMWFGGKNGLRRYDGYKVDVFRHDPDDPTSLSSNDISQIFVDSKGRLWIGMLSDGGLSQFDFSTQRFIHYKKDPSVPHTIGSNNIYAFAEDSDGDLWMATHDSGLNRLEHKTGHFHHYPIFLPGIQDGSVRDIAIDRQGNIWAATNSHGLYQVSPNREQFIHFSHNPNDKNSLSGDRLYRVYIDRYDSIWVGTLNEGLNRFDREKGHFVHYSHVPSQANTIGAGVIWDIGEDVQGNLWVATASGALSRYNKWQNNFEHFYEDPFSSNTLSGTVIQMYLDTSGDFWLGTYSSMLNRISESGEKFDVIRHSPINQNSLSGTTIYALGEDSKGNVWIGSDNGLTKMDVSGENFERFYHNPEIEVGLNNSFIRTLIVDQQDQVWLSTNSGISIYNPEEEQFQGMKEKYGVIPTDQKVWDILEDKQGIIWFGTQNQGLFRFNPKSGRLKTFTYGEKDPESLSHQFIWSLFEDSVGNLWVGTLWGLNLMDRNTNTFKKFKHDPNNSESLSNNSVRAIAEDGDGNIWLGTNSGLSMYNLEEDKFDVYRVKDGLADDSITAILVDEKNYVWVTTQKGISRFDRKTKKFKNFDVRHGIAGNSHPRNAATLKRSNGDLLFAGAHGVTSINPLQSRSNVFIPPVVLTDFFVNNQRVSIGKKSVLQKYIGLTKDVILNHNQNVFSIEFAALNYTLSDQNQYQYKLVGFDNKWQSSDGSQRRATYTNLDAGQYTFLVKGSNNEGLWNEKPAQLNITILSPWWLTWWFFSINLASFTMVIIFISRLRQIKVQEDFLTNKRLKNIDKLKRQFLANISSEFNTPLNAIIGLSENLLEGGGGEIPEKARKHVLIINENTQKLVALARDMLDFSSFNGSDDRLNLRPLHFEPILEGVIKWFQPQAENKSLKLYLSIEGDLPEIEADYSCIQKILFNLIDNAIKYTRHGYVDVIARCVEESILIQISDTGIGIPENKLKNLFLDPNSEFDDISVGLPRTKKYVELHGGSIYVDSTSPKGTMFIVRLPFGRPSEPFD